MTVDGRVVAAEVLEPAGHGFDEAALEAARQLRFRPARFDDGTPLEAIIRYRFTFRLPEVEAPAAGRRARRRLGARAASSSVGSRPDRGREGDGSATIFATAGGAR